MRVNNKLVTWSATYSVGVKVIDDQHKELLDLVNDMYNHVTDNEKKERAYFKSIIRQIVNYIKIHFATEEQIMKATKFKGYHEHKRSHDAFVLSVIDIIRDYEAGKRVAISTLTHFIKDWILSHTAIEDKQYFNHLTKRAARRASGRQHADREVMAA
jgi:hemerythrin